MYSSISSMTSVSFVSCFSFADKQHFLVFFYCQPLYISMRRDMVNEVQITNDGMVIKSEKSLDSTGRFLIEGHQSGAAAGLILSWSPDTGVGGRLLLMRLTKR